MGKSFNFRIGAALAALSLLVLQGCATSAQKTASMRGFMEMSQYKQALMEVEKEAGESTDDVMVNMNLGTLRRLTGDYQGSNEAFQRAKEEIENLYSTSITEQAGAVIVNDETISFQGDPFEQVLVHLYMASNYMAMGDLDAARVEVLQSHVKMDEWGEPKDEMPFMRYYSGMLFEMLGERDSALVSYRKAHQAYKATKEKHGLTTPRVLQQDLLRMLASMKLWDEYGQYKREFGLAKYKAPSTKGKGELIVMLGNGMVPQRDQKTIQTWSNALALNIKIAIPDYPIPPQLVNPVRVVVDGMQYPLETVSNLDGLARASLAEDMPVITTRAIARAVAKKTAEKEAGDRGGLFGQLAMMVVNQATEIADTRCWNTLPQEFQMARIALPPGQHEVKLEVLGAGGVVIDTINVPVKIKAGGKTVISKRWTAPRIMVPQATTGAANQAS